MELHSDGRKTPKTFCRRSPEAGQQRRNHCLDRSERTRRLASIGLGSCAIDEAEKQLIMSTIRWSEQKLENYQNRRGGKRQEGSPPAKKRSKYNAKKVVIDHIKFDSKKEGKYFEELKLRKAAGEVSYFLLQVPFHLPGGVVYKVDFQEFLADGTVRYIDTKGFETAEFKLKKKQVEALYPVTIEVV